MGMNSILMYLGSEVLAPYFPFAYETEGTVSIFIVLYITTNSSKNRDALCSIDNESDRSVSLACVGLLRIPAEVLHSYLKDSTKVFSFFSSVQHKKTFETDYYAVVVWVSSRADKTINRVPVVVRCNKSYILCFFLQGRLRCLRCVTSATEPGYHEWRSLQWVSWPHPPRTCGGCGSCSGS